MNLKKTIDKFFPEDKENLVKWLEADNEKLSKIELTRNEMNRSLPYMGNLYIVDDEGYFRGFVDFGGYKENPNNPSRVYDNTGKIKIWYQELVDYEEVQVWKINPKGEGTKFRKEDLIPQNEVVKYLLENSEQIRKPEYKIRKDKE